MELEQENFDRYAAQLRLPGFGVESQQKLSQAKVLIVGVGGLGSPLATYLTRAGIGSLGLVDSDLVELDNLQRQILYDETELGQPKAELAQRKLSLVNHQVKIVGHKTRLCQENILAIIKEYDFVADCSDNFATRFLVNDSCVLTGKPLIHGAVFRYEGQVLFVRPKQTACLRCVFEQEPLAEQVVSPQQAGVFSVVPGLIALIQATEIIKHYLGLGQSLASEMVIYDALSLSWRKVKVKKNPHCQACGSA